MGTNVTGTGITVVSSPFLDSLTDELALGLSIVPNDPFTPELVVVPNIGVRDWLQRELSSRLDAGRAGIVANVRFMFVQQFLDTVFVASRSPSIEPWGIETLTWVVHRAIERVGKAAAPGAASKPLTVARVIADLFDRYAVHRPSMLRYWRNGRAIDAVEPFQDLPDHMRWQQEVYSEVCRLIPHESPADRLAGLEDLIRDEGLGDNVPERISLFGFSSVNATVRNVLAAVGTARGCSIYLLHPMRSDGSARGEFTSRLVTRSHDVGTSSSGERPISINPLLTRWGRSALEASQVIAGRWTYVDRRPDSTPSDLDRLRQTIVDDTAVNLAPITEEDPLLARSDGSLQIHACHGRVRQVEVLRDAILHLLEDDPTLTLEQISIQCPDLVSFAPIIPAIFRSGQPREPLSPPSLDVSIADRVLTGENPYHDAFWSLFETAQSRCGVGDVLTLLAAEPIRHRFGVDDETLGRAVEWFDSLAVRFGLDIEHRRRWNLPDSIDVGTWDLALDRLFMGLAVPAAEPFQGPGGVVPHDDISVTDAPALARIADFLTRFRQLVTRLDTPHTVDEWAQIFASVIDDFFDDSEQSAFACRELLDASDRLRRAAQFADAADSEQFAFDEISALLADLVTSSSSRPRFRSGAITVTELLPQQGVPYRVIALLGVSEEMFAGGGLRGDDVLSLRPCVGDPMPSNSGRFQLLNVLLAAQDNVIITCDGADISNNQPIPLPVPIQELLEAMAAIRTDKSSTGTVNVFTRHPRQSFDTRALSPGHFRDDRSYTFDRVALDVHARRRENSSPILGQRLDSSIETTSAPRLSIDLLRKILAKPTDYFVHDVLGIRLPSSDVGTGNDFVDFWPSALDVSRAGRELLDAAMRTTAEPAQTVSHLLGQMALVGTFPPGHLGTKAAEKIGAEVLSILDFLPVRARQAENFRVVEIDSLTAPGDVNDSRIGGISGAVGNVLDFDLVRASFTRFRDDLVLDPWIELAVLGFVHPEHPWNVRLVARGSKDRAERISFTLAGSNEESRRASAERAIRVAVTLMNCMSRGRIPFLPKTSERLSRASAETTRSMFASDNEYSPSAQFLFGRVTWDEFIAEKPTDFDPDPTSSSRAQMFAQFVWRAFHETTTRMDDSWGAS